MRHVLVSALAVYLVVSCVAFVSPVLQAAQAPAASASKTVWDGAYSAAQADRGRTFFSGHCAECHGANLQGGEGKPLVGDQFWMDWREQSVGDLLSYVSANMPMSEDGSLKGTLPASTYADIVAHILKSNDFPDGTNELSSATAPAFQIVRKEGAGELPASTLVHVVGCLAPRAADGSWKLINASRPARSTGPVSADADRAAPLGDREYALKFVLTNLTRFVGHRMAVTGLLLGEGGVDGLNVSTVTSVAESCS
jgi:S-disulfanyl-L-cysteine oxidoreductase SoxD